MVFTLRLTLLTASCEDHRLIVYLIYARKSSLQGYEDCAYVILCKVYNKFPFGSQFVSKPDMKKADISELLCQYNIHGLKNPIGIILVGFGISKLYEHKQNDINR